MSYQLLKSSVNQYIRNINDHPNDFSNIMYVKNVVVSYDSIQRQWQNDYGIYINCMPVQVGVSLYMIPNQIEYRYLFESPTNWCVNQQICTYKELSRIISARLSKSVIPHVNLQGRILDFGSSPNIGQYEKQGSSCVVQSIYWSLYHKMSAEDKYSHNLNNVSNEDKLKAMGIWSGIDLYDMWIKSLQNVGIPLSDIKKSASNSQYDICIWSIETPTYMYYPNEIPKIDDVHIVIGGNHAMAFILNKANSPSREPTDCQHQCWNTYPGSKSEQIHKMGNQYDPRLHMSYYYISDTERDFAVVLEGFHKKTIYIGRQSSGAWHPQDIDIKILGKTALKISSNNLIGKMQENNMEYFEQKLQSYYKNPRVPNDVVQHTRIKYEMKDNKFIELATPFDVAAVVWNSDPERTYLSSRLSELAQKGILVAVDSKTYARLKTSGVQNARQYVKIFTSHNDKLGFDYSVPRRQYVASYSKQFSSSNYKQFLTQAAMEASNYYSPALVRHFGVMQGLYDINDKQRDKLLQSRGISYTAPSEPSMERNIGALQTHLDQLQNANSGLQQIIDQQNEDIDQLQQDQQKQNQQVQLYKNLIKGYESKVSIEPKDLYELPRKLRLNLQKTMKLLVNNDEIQYVKALVDPFHPDCEGVRVPSLLPRNTVTFNSTKIVNTSYISTNTQTLIIANFESPFKHYVAKIDLPSGFFDQMPVQQTVEVNGGLEDYTIRVIDTGLTNNQFKANLSLYQDNTPESIFVKQRIVAAGVRVFKTSASDNESGVLDMFYARDSSGVDENATFNQLFDRTTENSERVYLAGDTMPVRGKNGFLVQANLRPFDEASYDMRDATYERKSALFSDETALFWTHESIPRDDGTFLNVIHACYEIPSNDNPCKIVVESLHQRHTMITRLSQMSFNMTLSHEFIFHYEGAPEITKYGFMSKNNARLSTATSALQLIQSIPTQYIFSDYARKRTFILDTILDQPMQKGLWSETLFPKLKDLIRYGADLLPKGNQTDNWIEAALDTAVGTISTIIPEIAPAVMAMKQMAQKPLQDLVKSNRDALYDWAISGYKNHYVNMNLRPECVPVQHQSHSSQSKQYRHGLMIDAVDADDIENN